jgi:PAS domain S-box-containing protein
MISVNSLEFINGLPEPALLVNRAGEIVASSRKARVLLRERGQPTHLQDYIADPPSQLLQYLRRCFRVTDTIPGALTLRNELETRCRLEGGRVSVSPEGEALIWLTIVPHEQANRRFRQLNQRIQRLSKDVYNRTGTESALRARTVEFQALLNEAPLGVYMLDSDLRIRQMNPIARAVFGEFKALGRDLEELLLLMWPEAAILDAMQRFRSTLETGIPYISSETVQRRLGGEMQEYYEWQVSRIELPDGKFGLVCYFRDIGERKRAEAAIMKNEKLAAVGRLASTIAHEINNPLESVINLIYLAKNNSEKNSEAQRYLTIAEDEIARVANIAKQTLGFYRDNGAPSRLRVDEAVESVLALYAHRLRVRHVEVSRRFRGQPEIVAHAGEFRQLLSNLISNALDAMPSADAKLELSAVRVRGGTEGTGQGVRITISDNGCGIRRENLARVFEPFFTTKEATGTGLGLWVSQQIVQKHGGTIQARSQCAPPSQGTRFAIFWPAVAEVGLGPADRTPSKSIAAASGR